MSHPSSYYSSPSSTVNLLHTRLSAMAQLCGLLLVCLAAIFSSTSTISPVSAELSLYTNQNCNYTLYPKGGCEDDIGAECVDKRCKCKSGHTVLWDERFCLLRSCPEGQYWDQYKNQCERQRPASDKVTDSHCRYDYHCLGTHVRCRVHGWNRNCVCDAGFMFGYNSTCIPMHGIGGHCTDDLECDDTAVGSRKMHCKVSRNSEGTSLGTGGTCECLDDHTYNYQVDGCESNERIRERRSNMRILIILFVIAGSIFGFALTFNFGLFGGAGSRAHTNALLLKRMAEEKEREKQRQLQSQNSVRAAEEGSITSSPSSTASAPPPAADDKDKPEDLESKSADDKKKLIAF